MKPELTARSEYRVFRERVCLSRHATEREAICEAIKVKQERPDAAVRVDHDLQIDVELSD